MPGFYFSLFAFLVMFTGLFFTELFGNVYNATAYLTKAYPPSYINPPKSEVREGAQALTIDDIVAAALREQNEKEFCRLAAHKGRQLFGLLRNY